MREALFAGKFYEKTENFLSRQIEECFHHEKGPGALPSPPNGKPLPAIIVPHAAYQYSGPCAAWAYKAIAEREMPDLFILIGPSHHYEESGFSDETYNTPYGYLRVDQDFTRLLEEKGFPKNEVIHHDEHSLEVQVPFLQYAFKNRMEKIKIVPILIGNNVDINKLALDIKETLVETGKTATFIISSDFTHFGSNYKFVPFSKDVKKNIYDMDRGAIDYIKNMDALGFLGYVDETLATICGALPIALLLKILKKPVVNLEQYYTSGDLTDDYKNSVSYASFVFNYQTSS